MNDSSNINQYMDTYNTFSGCDITIVLNIPLMVNGNKIIKNYVVGEIQTLTYSTHMNRQPIRSISNVNAKDYVMGQRSIAGTMVFSVFDKHFASRIIDDLNDLYGTGIDILVDELPPFDINVVMANEYGHNSNIVIYGVRFINEGQVMSINDIYMENTYQYVATGMRYADNKKHPNKLIKENKIISKKPTLPEHKHIASSYDIYSINKAMPNQYDNINNKYKLVALNTQKHQWVGSKQEVSFMVNPRRRSGYIIIKDINNKEIAKLKYKNRILYALPRGIYYARYTDKDASSDTNYIIISKEHNKEEYIPENNEDKPSIVEKEKNPSINNPIIDDIEDDNITIIGGAFLKDQQGNEYYPDREGHIYGLTPDTKYFLYYQDYSIEIKTEKDKYKLYEKLKESSLNKFKDKEIELNKILHEIEQDIYNDKKDLLESLYYINIKYNQKGNYVYKQIVENLLLNMTMLIQNKKSKINNNSKNMPTIENYYSNKILIDKDSIKMVVSKFPYSENIPYEIYSEDFIYDEGKRFYEINDPNNNLYKIYSIKKNGIRTPSIYLFSGINKKSIISTSHSQNNDISDFQYYKNKVYIHKNLLLAPELQYIDKNIIKLYHEDINKDEYIVCCNAKYLGDKARHIKKESSSGFVFIDNYETSIEKDSIFLAWIENDQSEVISKVLVFVLDDNMNKKINEHTKNELYNYLIRREEYKRLNSLTKQVVLKTIEESNINSWKTLKTTYSKEFVKNAKEYNVNIKNIIFFDLVKYNSLFGISKKEYTNKMIKKKDRIFLNNNEVAIIDVICKTTGELKQTTRKNLISLSYFQNKILIIKIKDKNVIYKPFIVLPDNDYEVM